MAKIPQWLLGRHVSTITITPMVVQSNGTLAADASASSLTGTLDEIEVDSQVASENISPMDVRTSHHVPVEDDFALVFTEVLKTGAGVNVFASLFVGYDFFLVVVSRGNQSWTAYLSRGSYTEGLRKGKSVGRAQMRRINVYDNSNIYQTNPVLATVVAPAY